jgi:hypothetical protein
MENIKIKSTVVPNEQLTYNEWTKRFNVSVLCNYTSKLTDRADQMMSSWDNKIVIKHIKKLKVG